MKNLILNTVLASRYTSQSQKIRVLTEAWVAQSIFCPNCGNEALYQHPNNRPVADFGCDGCKEDYELKSKSGPVGKKIVDGAYQTMINRLESSENPNLFLLGYDHSLNEVQNFVVIPKQFFMPSVIEKRKPLSVTAKRAGWTGCNILLGEIPQSGKIYVIKDRKYMDRKTVLADWQKTLFLRDEKKLSAKGWLLDTMLCIERIRNAEFSLDQLYQFEPELAIKHPKNMHIKDKIRQQLQLLRDAGYVEFMSKGRYRRS